MTLSQNTKTQSVSREIGGRTLTIESGWMAKQASGAVVVTFGETAVLSAVVNGGPRDLPFFPLTVDYREKTFAAGKIPGGFFRREGRPTTKEILAMRMTDRSVRPMFAEGFRNEVQIMSSVLSYDQENEPEALSMIGAFAALHLSEIPFLGPMGAVRLGWVDGNVLINPTHTILQDPKNRLDLILAATPDAIAMVEAGAGEIPEEEVLKALQAGHEVCRTICEMCVELRGKVDAPPKVEAVPPEPDREMEARILETLPEARFREVLLTQGKHARQAARESLREEAFAALAPAGETPEALQTRERVKAAFKEVANRTERKMISEGQRTDGRDTRTVRPITIEAGLLPRVHGSALFTRGETQALVTATLGTADDEQIIDGLHSEDERRRFLLHYNFPPFCVGEARPIRGTSRREYGHGALAERALLPVLPAHEDFPYTLRIVSDILESNGSSSMATVCGGSLALMDAGVPMRAPVAGIAMGLVQEGDNTVVLTDILGSEDHHGDMDFKVAGTREGITALQMDIKIKGLKWSILSQALDQAREGRMFILDRMAEVLDKPRPELSAHAPINTMIMIPKEKIGFLIGPKGANIRKLQEDYQVNISVVGDTGEVQVSGTPKERVDRAIEVIQEMTRLLEPGMRLKGKVVSIKPFGCFVDVGGGQEGMCHISELSDQRVEEVEDVCSSGDEMEVIVVNVDDSGKIRLSRRLALLPEEELPAALEATRNSGPRGGGGRGGRDRGGPGRGDRGRGGRDRGDRGWGDRGRRDSHSRGGQPAHRE